jgi:hypothetical protein
VCIQATGDRTCPDGWPDRHVVYDGADDSRSCSDCTCGQPEGGTCSGLVSLYKDGACSALVDAVSVVSDGPTCVQVQPKGSALGSQSLSMIAYQPGACAPGGGEPTGALTPTGPTTFCCHM